MNHCKWTYALELGAIASTVLVLIWLVYILTEGYWV